MKGRSPDWRRLAEIVTKRRHELGLTQGEVQAAGGPSVATMRMIEGALQEGYRGNILGRLERALEWQPGSIEAILEAGDPRPVPAQNTEQPVLLFHPDLGEITHRQDREVWAMRTFSEDEKVDLILRQRARRERLEREQDDGQRRAAG